MKAFPCPVSQALPLATGAFRASDRLVVKLTVGALPFYYLIQYPVCAFRASFRLVFWLTERLPMLLSIEYTVLKCLLFAMDHSPSS